MLVLFLCFSLCFSLQINDPETITVNDKDEHVLEVESSQSKDYVIVLPYSYKLLIELDYINTYSLYGDYLLIKRGPDFDDPGTGLVLTENGYSGTKKTILVSSNTTYIRLYLGNLTAVNSNDILRKFKLKFKASGSGIITTTQSPTSPSTWPTPGPKDKIHYRAHLQGLADVDFANNSFNIYRLKTAIAKMADAYCTAQLFPVKQEIGTRNVIISDLIRCPYSWPNSEQCVIVNFAVPVVLDDSYDGYQLLSQHLEIMWMRYERYLSEIGLSNYKILDLDSNLVGWKALIGIILSGLIIVVFTIALLLEFKPETLNCFARNQKQDERPIIPEAEMPETYVYNEEEYDKFNYRSSGPASKHSERNFLHAAFPD